MKLEKVVCHSSIIWPLLRKSSLVRYLIKLSSSQFNLPNPQKESHTKNKNKNFLWTLIQKMMNKLEDQLE